MNREDAIKIAQKHAKAYNPSYYSEPFQPHGWVIASILEAANSYPEALMNQDVPYRTPPSSAFNAQIGGSHYKDMGIQPVEFIIANQLGFCEGNAVKYLCRYKTKGGVEDLKKAKHYIEMLIEEVDKSVH